MISDTLQDQAALYALGLLDAEEAKAFEAELQGNAELRDCLRELTESAGNLVRVLPAQTPPPELRDRVVREIALEKQAAATPRERSAFSWIPWAIAAAVALLCAYVVVDRARLANELAQARARDPLSQTSVYVLAPAAPSAPPNAKAAVTWAAASQTGLIKVTNLPSPGPAKDYQLWAVDANHKDPVSAGIIKVDVNGNAEVRFKPVNEAARVKAFAISLEREGGVPKAEGPILLAGSS